MNLDISGTGASHWSKELKRSSLKHIQYSLPKSALVAQKNMIFTEVKHARVVRRMSNIISRNKGDTISPILTSLIETQKNNDTTKFIQIVNQFADKESPQAIVDLFFNVNFARLNAGKILTNNPHYNYINDAVFKKLGITSPHLAKTISEKLASPDKPSELIDSLNTAFKYTRKFQTTFLKEESALQGLTAIATKVIFTRILPDELQQKMQDYDPLMQKALNTVVRENRINFLVSHWLVAFNDPNSALNHFPKELMHHIALINLNLES